MNTYALGQLALVAPTCVCRYSGPTISLKAKSIEKMLTKQLPSLKISIPPSLPPVPFYF